MPIHAGASDLRFEGYVPPGALWKSSSSGWKYSDRNSLFSGANAITLRASSGGSNIAAKLKARYLFAWLQAPPFHQDPEVRVQLKNGRACWDASYTTSLVNTDANGRREFKARTE